jgi:hypothetical protein
MAIPELDIARVQRWCAARVPEHARHQVRVECQVAPGTSPSSSGALPGATTTGRTGPASRSRACATPPQISPGPCTGATATCDSTTTTCSHHRAASTTCSARSTATQPASSGANPKLPPPDVLPPRPRRGQLSPSQRGQFRLTPPPQDVLAVDLVMQRMEPPVRAGLGRPVKHMLQRADPVPTDSRQGGPSRISGTHQSGPFSVRVNEAAALPITGGCVVRPARPVLRPPPTPSRRPVHFPAPHRL